MFIITWQLKSDTVIRHYHYEMYAQAMRQLKALRQYEDVKYASMKWTDSI